MRTFEASRASKIMGVGVEVPRIESMSPSRLVYSEDVFRGVPLSLFYQGCLGD